MKKINISRNWIRELNSRTVTSVLIMNLLSTFPSIEETQKALKGKLEPKILRICIAIPVLCIALAELLIFSGKIATAICIHIGILVVLSLSNILIKDSKVHDIYMPLMLFPLLRLISFSVPIFFKTTLYTFVLIYSSLAIPIVAIIILQRNSLEEIGITTKNFLFYMVLSVPLAFLIGLGEYLCIRTGYLIPNLNFVNIFKLTFVMIFFVGLVEELIFRSILQTRLERALNLQDALIITSLMFGIMHSVYGNFYEILYTCFVGFVIGLLYYKTKSLPFVAVLHGFANVFLFGILPHLLISGYGYYFF